MNIEGVLRSIELEPHRKLSIASALVYAATVQLIIFNVCFGKFDFFLFSSWRDILFQANVFFWVVIYLIRSWLIYIHFVKKAYSISDQISHILRRKYRFEWASETVCQHFLKILYVSPSIATTLYYVLKQISDSYQRDSFTVNFFWIENHRFQNREEGMSTYYLYHPRENIYHANRNGTRSRKFTNRLRKSFSLENCYISRKQMPKSIRAVKSVPEFNKV